MSEKNSKEKIMSSAAELFYYNGFKGTSIRAITDRAKVNVSLISYYFKNKQGLLEKMTVDYFEQYLELLEQLSVENSIDDSNQFFNLIEEIIHYKYDQFQFTCFIQRELSLDNTFIREMSSTYLAKEKYYFDEAVEKMVKSYGLNEIEQETFYIQLKSVLNGPFTYANDWQNHYNWDQSGRLFIRTYINTLRKWFPAST
ncbi:TetR/AcrR family transcriptional regulator [Halalkalibacillus sediminis]|uniref:TetR/AcrR family transcriptional regulator n=1 Tax=Halalkalibacillus sediminis TaxID=2018042 RepID=A0A2I0QY84_9BACI|nr:forespore capture DNA-binding protein RefZ [Halalkalibacillus sediminis]PKR79295.1 TetR/AcrR family transcriptional regulator [Halalkalibacillus sediminis]